MERKLMRHRLNEADVADYILDYHNGDAKAAIKAMQDEIEHLQHQLSLAVVAMGRGYTRGWAPGETRDGQ
ncbi:hypothetical protein [Agrobacterium bohemicum]|nr:hypothetical protein [Agrobacterium bohemicum]